MVNLRVLNVDGVSTERLIQSQVTRHDLSLYAQRSLSEIMYNVRLLMFGGLGCPNLKELNNFLSTEERIAADQRELGRNKVHFLMSEATTYLGTQVQDLGHESVGYRSAALKLLEVRDYVDLESGGEPPQGPFSTPRLQARSVALVVIDSVIKQLADRNPGFAEELLRHGYHSPQQPGADVRTHRINVWLSAAKAAQDNTFAEWSISGGRRPTAARFTQPGVVAKSSFVNG